MSFFILYSSFGLDRDEFFEFKPSLSFNSAFSIFKALFSAFKFSISASSFSIFCCKFLQSSKRFTTLPHFCSMIILFRSLCLPYSTIPLNGYNLLNRKKGKRNPRVASYSLSIF
ncbi:hypothetical protein wGmm_0240 [Wolbachia endosymbiont of Glossina morsitans morsitans]|nr:hypothetical protein wGmm_0240 [Wolbachia endosymbiont of Glossina morsitans morsitans]